jgi:AcrR family transcriptional regulator
MSNAESRRAGRPRDERIDQGVLDAAAALLERGGFAALSMDGIAKQAGVSRQALYQRYDDPIEVVVGLMRRYRAGLNLPPPTGDLRIDYQRFLEVLQGFYLESDSILAAILGEAAHNERLRAALRAHFLHTDHRREVLDMFETARKQKRLPKSADPELLAEAGSAILFHRLLVTQDPLTPDLPARIVRMLLP